MTGSVDLSQSLLPLLQVPACEECGAEIQLAVRVLGKLICASCWRRARQPPPAPSDDLARLGDFQLHELEENHRKRMMRRKGADLHQVRSGRT